MMEDGDGVKIACGEVESSPNQQQSENEEIESTKQTPVRDQIISSNSVSKSHAMFLGLNNINGDCGEKNVGKSESSFVRSSSVTSSNSETSNSSEESIREQTCKMDVELSSEGSAQEHSAKLDVESGSEESDREVNNMDVDSNSEESGREQSVNMEGDSSSDESSSSTSSSSSSDSYNHRNKPTSTLAKSSNVLLSKSLSYQSLSDFSCSSDSDENIDGKTQLDIEIPDSLSKVPVNKEENEVHMKSPGGSKDNKLIDKNSETSQLINEIKDESNCNTNCLSSVENKIEHVDPNLSTHSFQNDIERLNCEMSFGNDDALYTKNDKNIEQSSVTSDEVDTKIKGEMSGGNMFTKDGKNSEYIDCHSLVSKKEIGDKYKNCSSVVQIDKDIVDKDCSMLIKNENLKSKFSNDCLTNEKAVPESFSLCKDNDDRKNIVLEDDKNNEIDNSAFDSKIITSDELLTSNVNFDSSNNQASLRINSVKEGVISAEESESSKQNCHPNAVVNESDQQVRNLVGTVSEEDTKVLCGQPHTENRRTFDTQKHLEAFDIGKKLSALQSITISRVENTNESKVGQKEVPKARRNSVDIVPRFEGIDKTSPKSGEKITKSLRRKTDEKNTSSNEQYNPMEKFPIQYKGFKKVGNFKASSAKRSFLCWNPFNPARKKDIHSGRYILQKSLRGDVDCSTLQPEYAQYLGLQPIVKFKCSNCGLSTFQSMSALNTHQIDCKKNGKPSSLLNENTSSHDINSANIKLTRKVFLCSTCGTYYESCNLFLHMREFHRRYICLFCLYMGHSPESLSDHLKEKHNVVIQDYSGLDELIKKSAQSFFLLCLTCDKVFTECDDSCNHKCTPKNASEIEQNSLRKSNSYGSSECTLQDTIKTSGEADGNEMVRLHDSLCLNNDVCLEPASLAPVISNSIEEELKLSESKQQCNQQPVADMDMSSSENLIYKPSFVQPPTLQQDFNSFQSTSAQTDETFRIKVPSDIEIKPLIPGENKSEPRNESGIEIFPINSQPPKTPLRKMRTVNRRTIKKKKPLGRGRKYKTDNSFSLQKDDLEDETDIVPVSPPVIAPPPIVKDSPMDIDEPISLKPAFEEHLNDPETNITSESESQPTENPCPPSPDSSHEEHSRSETLMSTDLHEQNVMEIKKSLPQDFFKMKLPREMESDGESDDSQKLSLVVDENTNTSEIDMKKTESPEEKELSGSNELEPVHNSFLNDPLLRDIPLARDDVPAMALTLDDKIENVSIQAVVKECVRTSCLSCNYCKHAVKIAVNGKELALHLLSEHRYTPVKNETNEDVVRKLTKSLETLENMYFNSETYDSSDPSIHNPYDKENNFDCFQCSYVSSSHKDLYAHKKKYHTKSLLLCIMCKKSFFSYSELICHICAGTYSPESHHYCVDINFRCCFCRLDTIPSGFRLMVHLRKSHHTCDICLEMCSDQQKLSTHMWKHKLHHLCYRCGIAYASKPDITKHLFWKHGTESVLCKKCLQKKWPHVYHFCIPPASFICEECNTSFSKAVALKVHKRTHGNDYPYPCPQCEKKFVSKKLLSRHIDRHNAIIQKKDVENNSPEDNREEIINVTDVDNKENFQNEHSDSNKDSDGKEKSHKKHKKEKDKKEKKVLDVYDLPPLNLSSESDSSDDESIKKVTSKETFDNGLPESNQTDKIDIFVHDKPNSHDMPKLDENVEDFSSGDKSLEPSPFINLLNPGYHKKDEDGDEIEDKKQSPSNQVLPFDNSVVTSLLPLVKDESKLELSDSGQIDHVKGIWENFYKKNPQNSNLPFPLCAMKSEVAYSIIMGDHDYCIAKIEPVIKEDLPSTSNLDNNLSDDKLEEVLPLILEKPQTPPPKEAEGNSSTPSSVSKKKLKSPKKKIKTPDDNNSSSSSDSSSDSEGSSCSCGTNCSCSGSSSDSSSSSSSDSDSSTNEDKKQDKRKKKKDRRSQLKSEGELDTMAKELTSLEPDSVPLLEPEDPPIRESELETDESTSDEEFYDRQPQVIANQMIAEKRHIMIQAAAATPVNNGSASPTVALPQPTPPPLPAPVSAPPPPLSQPNQENILPMDILDTPKPKQRAKRKKRMALPKWTAKMEKPLPEPTFSKYPNETKSPFSLFQQSPSIPKQKLALSALQSPSQPEAGGSGSETDSTRLSKRRRVPNKFYGYSSGEDDERQVPKWRKGDSTPGNQTPRIAPILAPPNTPRIQLTVPKQIIKRQYHKQTPKQKPQSSSDSSDSGTSDIEERILPPRPPVQEPVKSEKDVYCYCRCPYDEVSEMIACDATNCPIEWFHFECVGILVPPRGQWFCPGCRKERGIVTTT